MKSTELLRELADIAKSKGLGLDLVRHGANHDIYQIGAVVLVVGRTVKKARTA